MRSLRENTQTRSSKDTDRMRSFNSSMMLSDVLAERDNQIRIKEELDRLERIRDTKYDELVKHNYQQLTRREEAEKQKLKEKKNMVAIQQRQQLEEAIAKRKSEIQANKIEGFEIRLRNEKYAQDELLEAQAEKERFMQAQKETAKAQKYLREIKDREEHRHAKEELKIEEYSKQQSKMSQLRQEREKAVFRAKQEHRQKLIDAQAARLAAIRDREDERIGQQVRDAEEAQNKLLTEKAVLMEQWKADIRRSHAEDSQRKEAEKSEKGEQEKKAAEFSRLLFRKFAEDESREQEVNRRAQTKLKEDLLGQINAKNTDRIAEKVGERDCMSKAKRAHQNEVNEFQAFAEHSIREYSESGRNVIPLIQALKDFHKMQNH